MKQQTQDKTGGWFFLTVLQFIVAMAALCLIAGAPAWANRELGTWLNTDRKGKIQLRECGEQSLCGEIIWLKDAKDENGKPWRDELNPDPKLRSRPVVGIDVLVGVKKIGPMTWQGQIYDPEVGKLYYLKHLKVGHEKVEIKGCLSTGWPCRTKYWTRVEPPKPQPPVNIARRNTAPKPKPAPQRLPPPVVAPPPASTPPTPVAPPAQAQAPYPPQPPQTRAPMPPAPAERPAPPEVTASLPRPAVDPRPGGYLVQVAARQSHNEALRAFNDLQRQYPQLLGDLVPEVIRADLGQRGIWYRVGVGGMAQQSAAADFCNQLKSVGADCLIRRR